MLRVKPSGIVSVWPPPGIPVPVPPVPPSIPVPGSVLVLLPPPQPDMASAVVMAMATGKQWSILLLISISFISTWVKGKFLPTRDSAAVWLSGREIVSVEGVPRSAIGGVPGGCRGGLSGTTGARSARRIPGLCAPTSRKE